MEKLKSQNHIYKILQKNENIIYHNNKYMVGCPILYGIYKMDNDELIKFIIKNRIKINEGNGYYDFRGMYNDKNEPQFLTYEGWAWVVSYVEQEQG